MESDDMTHGYVRAFEAAEQFICKTHGTPSAECRNTHRLASIGIATATGVGLGAMVAGKEGAAWGGLAFGLLGAVYPEFAETVRAANLAGKLHA